MISELKVLVAGCGSIGRRHIQNLRTLGVRKFVLCDPSIEALEKAMEGLEGPELTKDFDQALLFKPDAAVICTPSNMHLDMGLRLADRGVHLLIEKPLSHSLERAAEFERLVCAKGIVAMVAMCYRFHPVLTHLKKLLDSGLIGRLYHVNYLSGQYLPDWHPYADYKLEYAARRDLGGGAVLTNIHSLDDLRWLFGEVEEVRGFTARVSGLELDVEDLACGAFRFESGLYAVWQTDYLQRTKQHRMHIVGEKGILRCDFVEGSIETYLADFGKWHTERIKFDINSMYVDEMRHFLECVEGGRKPIIDVTEGVKTLRLALSLKEQGVPFEGRACA